LGKALVEGSVVACFLRPYSFYKYNTEMYKKVQTTQKSIEKNTIRISSSEAEDVVQW
jgi:hypothetical protein